MDGMGWIPVDVTPGFYYDTYALLQMAQVPGDIQRTAALEDSGEEVDAPDSLHAGKRPDSEVIDQLKTAVNILWGILLVVLLFKGIGIVLLEFRHLITERRLLGILELPPGDRAGMMFQGDPPFASLLRDLHPSRMELRQDGSAALQDPSGLRAGTLHPCE